MTNLDALSTALDGMFAQPIPEAGTYASAPRAAIQGGRKWARLLIGAMKEQGGSYGVAFLRILSPTTLKVTRQAGSRWSVDVHEGNVSAWLRHGDHAVYKSNMMPFEPISPVLDSLFSNSGYPIGGVTLRAQSPTDITLSLDGDRVAVQFSPPLKVSKSVLSFSVAKVNVEETRLHIVVDGFLGKDQYIDLAE